MFQGTPDPLPPASTLSYFRQQYQCKPEVETVPKSGSTNKLATETDIDAISMAIPT